MKITNPSVTLKDGISPIQKQEPERIKINDIFYVEGHERSHLCVGYQGVEMDPIAENGLPYQRSKCSLKPFPNFEKYSAYQQSETVATSGTNYVAPDNQEELKRKVIHLIRDFWKFDNNQQPMSSWHDKQDLIERIEKL